MRVNPFASPLTGPATLTRPTDPTVLTATVTFFLSHAAIYFAIAILFLTSSNPPYHGGYFRMFASFGLATALTILAAAAFFAFAERWGLLKGMLTLSAVIVFGWVLHEYVCIPLASSMLPQEFGAAALTGMRMFDVTSTALALVFSGVFSYEKYFERADSK